jgi:hypothetical protein
MLGVVLVGANAVAAWAVLGAQALDRVVAAVVAIVLATVVVVGWRRRLTVGPRGLVVSGISGSRIVPWSEVTGLHTATSSRLGITSTTLEIDLVDDDLLVFGRTDLGVDITVALDDLVIWRH